MTQTIDQVAARELVLWADNTEKLWNVLYGIAKGAKKAQDTNTYSEPKLNASIWRLVGATVKDYRDNFGQFYVNYETRGEVAAQLKEEIMNYVEVDLKEEK